MKTCYVIIGAVMSDKEYFASTDIFWAKQVKSLHKDLLDIMRGTLKSRMFDFVALKGLIFAL